MAKTAGKYLTRLSEQAIEGFAAFLDNKQHWEKITVEALEFQAASSMFSFCRHISDRVRLDIEAVVETLTAIHNMKLRQKSIGCSAIEIVEEATATLSRAWETAKIDAWKESSDDIVALLDRFDGDSALMLSSKAQRLVYDRPAILRGVRIITDLSRCSRQRCGEHQGGGRHPQSRDRIRRRRRLERTVFCKRRTRP